MTIQTRLIFFAPAKRFIDIISTRYEDNFMPEEMSIIRINLLQKNELNADNLEIIGVILEKQDGTEFSKDDAEIVYGSADFINYIYL